MKELIRKRNEAEKALLGRHDQLTKEIRGITDSKQKAEQAKNRPLINSLSVNSHRAS